MDLGLAGKVGLVAGASQGLGKAIATRLAREGMRLTICARGADLLRKTAGEIQGSTQSEVLAIPADVTRDADIKNVVRKTVAQFGSLDVLVTNAGGPPTGRFLGLDDSAWEQAFQLTLMSAVRLCRESVPHMQKRGWGRIIHVTSVSVKQPLDNLLLSNSLRLAVIGLSKTLANELAVDGITVNAVCPGLIATQRLDELFTALGKSQGISVDEVRRSWTKEIPLGRLGRPEELADLVAFLASENARYITGVAIQADGGRVKGYS